MKKKLHIIVLALLAMFSFAMPIATAQAQTTPPTQPTQPPSSGGLGWMLPGGDNDGDAKKSLAEWQQTFSMPNACWGCVLFSKMASVTLDIGKQGEQMFAGPAISAMNAFMGLWVVWQLYLLVSPANSNSPSQTIDTIFQRLVLMMIVLFILKQGSFQYIMEGFVFPAIGSTMASATSLIPGGGGGCSGGGGGSGASAQLVQQGTGLMCAMHIEMGRGMGLGAFLMDSAEFSFMPGGKFEVFQFFGGLIVFLAFLAMLVMLPFRLFDALIRLTVVSVVLPLIVLAYQFKPTRGACKQAATSLLAAGLTFLFTALAVAVSVRLLQDVARPVLDSISDGSSDSFVGPLDGNQFMILVAAAIGMAAFIKQAGTIAAEFAGFQGSMGSVGGAGAAATGGAMVATGGAAGLAAGRTVGMGARMGAATGRAAAGRISGTTGSAAARAGTAEMTR